MDFKKELFWNVGEKKEIAFLSGITQSHFSEILHRKRGVGKERAITLERMSNIVLENPIPMQEWLFNKTSVHPAFYGGK